MEKILRNSPTYSVVIALVIQVTRVSDFGFRINAGYLAIVFAIFLALTIFSLSYWSGRLQYDVTATPEEKAKYVQQKRTERLFSRARWSAQFWLGLFVIIEGAINLAETMTALPGDVLFWEYAGAVVYGIFPTLAVLGLGSLQAYIDKVPVGPSKASFSSKLADKLLARIDAAPVQANKQAPALLAPDNKADDKSTSKIDKPPLTDNALLAYWQVNPQASDSQVAKHFGRSTQAIQQRRTKLTERGAFYKAEQALYEVKQ
jgi:hypothetical protein